MSKRKNDRNVSRVGTWTLDEPRGDVFAALLTAGLRHADRACMVTPEVDDPAAPYLAVRTQLDRFALRPAQLTWSWPGSPHSVRSRVSTYKFCAAFIECLLASGTGWFDWRLPLRPEDLSLLRGDAEWLVSVTHERLIFLQTDESVLKELLNQIPAMRIKSGPGFRGGRHE
jgi:hypothetical protein